MGSSNENSAYGPALNPWDRTRVPGGSSGGSAAAVAAGSAPWALGTDTGGSIRQPAALCGIVGLKPTYGAVSRYGMIAFASSLDQAGPLTRDVTDSALLFRHMVGHDDRDATSVAFPEEVRLPTAQRLDGIRLGVPDDLTGEGVEPGVHGALRGHARRRARAGRDRRARRPAARRLRPERLLRARPGRGVLEPRALRRRALRAAPRGRRPADDVHEDAPRRLRRRGQAAHADRDLRALQRLLRRLLRPRAARAHEDRRGLPRGLRARRLRRHPDEPGRRLRARRQDRRPAGHVPQRLLHRADAAGRDPRDLDPERAERGAARRLSARRAPPSARIASSTPPTRSSRRSASTTRRARA